MDPYATHLEALVTTALSTTGPILEMGCGHYSTPLLAAIARHGGREFVVHASNREWAEKFADIASIQIVDWDNWEPPRFGMALLDSEEHTSRRLGKLPKLLERGGAVVVHDADIVSSYPAWQSTVTGRAVEFYKRHKPWTAVIR